ncbi:MAG: radical SAM protein, partial [Bacteroidota bacterium]
VLYNPEAVFYTMPLALIAVAAGLDRERYEVVVIDGRLEENAEQRVVDACEGAVCLGVTALTGGPLWDALKISRAVKRAHPEVPVVWGGWHPSLFPTDTLQEWSVDVTVQAQGEKSFPDLVEALATGRPLSEIHGIAYRDQGMPRQTQPRHMADMNTLPMHRYELLDVERYYQLKGQRQMDYISSTGCFFRCAFCADPFVFRRSWTGLDPERVGAEVDLLWQRYPFDELAFQDETFFTKRKRVVQIAEAFLQHGRGFDWTATMRADQGMRLGDNAFKLCVDSGMRRVLIGVESGSQEMMDWMQKDIKVEQVIHCAEQCVRYGIGAIFPFIVGFPNETPESVKASMDMAKQLRAMSPDFETPVFFFKPYPGSKITADAVAAGYTLPTTVEGWAGFDFVGSSGPWVDSETEQLVKRYGFYGRLGYSRRGRRMRPLAALARWRVRNNAYRFPVEQLVAERLFKRPTLS